MKNGMHLFSFHLPEFYVWDLVWYSNRFWNIDSEMWCIIDCEIYFRMRTLYVHEGHSRNAMKLTVTPISTNKSGGGLPQHTGTIKLPNVPARAKSLNSWDPRGGGGNEDMHHASYGHLLLCFLRHCMTRMFPAALPGEPFDLGYINASSRHCRVNHSTEASYYSGALVKLS